MKYYKLELSRNRKEVGIKPQSEWGNFGDIQQDFIPWQGTIDFGFKLPEPNLEKKAKLTSSIDVAFIPALFLMIEDSFLDFLKSYNIGNYQNWKIKTWQNKRLIEKYNLFLVNDTKQAEYIDFSRSEFYSKKLGDWKNISISEPIFVKDYNAYVIEKEKLRKDKLMLLHSKVILNLHEVKKDMFRIVNAPPGGYFISEKLKNAIEANNFTGMAFTEVSELDKVEVIY